MTDSALVPVDYLAVGHVTADVRPDGHIVPGGAVTYAALTAVALGLRAGIVTRGDPAFIRPDLLPGVTIHLVAAPDTTTFVNTYDAHGARHQRVLALAPPLTAADVPRDWRQPAIAHFGTVVHEVGPDVMDAVMAGFVGLGPQGWLRQVAVGEAVHRGPWLGPDGLLPRADAVILSDEDLEGEPRGEAWFARQTDLLVMTAGPAGARARFRGIDYHQPALRVDLVDPTGAGDSFAAGFFIRMAETGDVADALAFAAAVAAFTVEQVGPGGVPGRAAVERRAQGRNDVD